MALATDLTWIEISPDNLAHNLGVIREQIGPDKLLAPCVKANAYGHGLVGTARILLAAGADWLGVNSLAEAQQLRTADINCPLLILGYVAKADLARMIELEARIFLSDFPQAEILSRLAAAQNKTAKVHLKIDTGMHRQGVLADQARELAAKIFQLPHLEVEGLATHFANSDEPNNPSYFQGQLTKFEAAAADIQKLAGRPLIIHCDKSASALLYHHQFSNLVRPGIAVYGHYPSQDVAQLAARKNIILKPALTLKTRIAQIKNIPPDSFVGYGCSFRTTRESKTATIPIGYHDGYDRQLSNRGYTLVNGRRAPILGRVCMNITIIDITDCGQVAPEDEVVLLGRQGDETISAEQIAAWTETINYEVLARLRESLPRYYV